jgi:hypothetical protein
VGVPPFLLEKEKLDFPKENYFSKSKSFCIESRLFFRKKF